MREATLTTQIVRWLNAQPATCVRKRHGSPFGVGGDPDITGCVAGRHVEIEVKRPGEQPTPRQRQRLAEWARAGALVGVVTDLAAAQRLWAQAAQVSTERA